MALQRKNKSEVPRLFQKSQKKKDLMITTEPLAPKDSVCCHFKSICIFLPFHLARMRFSGLLVDEGIRLLERSLLPACQKTGKKIFLLLSSEDVYLVQDETEAQGMHVVAGIKAVRWVLLSNSVQTMHCR